ncbi:MAG: hypothetical protein Aureis2KO_29270 [Aureisphaera sp.]
MKSKLFFTALFLLFSTAGFAQAFNQEVTLEGKKPFLLGKINKEGFTQENYPWFNENYQAYPINSTAIDTLERHLDKYTITAFMGTWCGDSKRETPRFYKVLEQANFPLERLTMVAVSRDRETYKQSPGGEHESLNIHRVPTFIIYKNGKEVNRIVESPVETLEEDLVKIIQKEYTPNYHGVTLVNDMLTEMNLNKFNKKQRKLLPKLKELVTNMYELNTYANVLFYAHKKEEAIIVARLNTLLYPEEPKTYVSLANKLSQNADPEGAMENYKKALSLDPENEEYKKTFLELQGLRNGTQ